MCTPLVVGARGVISTVPLPRLSGALRARSVRAELRADVPDDVAHVAADRPVGMEQHIDRPRGDLEDRNMEGSSLLRGERERGEAPSGELDVAVGIQEL